MIAKVPQRYAGIPHHPVKYQGGYFKPQIMDSNPLDSYTALIKYARYFGASLDDAKDYVQTAYEEYYTRGYNGVSILYRIVMHRMMNERNRWKPAVANIDAITSPVTYDLDLYDAEYHRNRINQLGIHKNPLKLFIDGYSYDEIAQMENISMGTVKSRIHTARKRLGV